MPASTESGARLSARAQVALTAALTLLVAIIGALDCWSGNEIALTIFYLIPISLGAWFVGPRTGNYLALLSAGVWLLADLYGGRSYDRRILRPWNALVSLAFSLIPAYPLSARKRTERRLLELLDIKSELTSMVSHELRTPLTCVKEGIDIVADGTAGPLNSAQRMHLQTAKRNVDRLARLLDQVLTFQKFDAHRVELVVEPPDLKHLVQQAAEGFDLPARKKGVLLVLDLAHGLPLVACDTDKISQVLSNLLSNALKFTEDGQIDVRTEPRQNSVRVLVHDQGPGIPSADLERVFQGFTQLATDSGRPVQGTGLGLAIAQQIVELHGGRIGVESVAGCGATFHFTLPVHEQAPAARFIAALHERRA